MNNNKESTRYYSDAQEKQVCKLLNMTQTANSGAGRFRKGDCYSKEASLLCECKTVMSPKSSISIKKDWIIKNKEEAFSNRLYNSCIAFNFEPEGDNYFVINESMMEFLVKKLSEEFI